MVQGKRHSEEGKQAVQGAVVPCPVHCGQPHSAVGGKSEFNILLVQ